MPSRQQLIDTINGCINAKRESQKELYRLYYGFAKGICMRYSTSQQDVIEIVNDGFLKIFKTIKNFNAKNDNVESSFMAWAKQIMIFTAIDHYRKNIKEQYKDELNDIHFDIKEYAETSIDSMSYKEIIAIIQQLPSAYKTVFNLYVIDGYKHEEIAKQLKISVGTSKSNLAKARIKMQKMLSTINVIAI